MRDLVESHLSNSLEEQKRNLNYWTLNMKTETPRSYIAQFFFSFLLLLLPNGGAFINNQMMHTYNANAALYAPRCQVKASVRRIVETLYVGEFGESMMHSHVGAHSANGATQELSIANILLGLPAIMDPRALRPSVMYIRPTFNSIMMPPAPRPIT
ncbi:uncharacterized protein ARMOST_11836 [Armillaria ostoyae]|uniref:Uncharacterized protein n=1 Tax=Armillaria ostoyae TaxID=47428 RepID=A0A284RIA2_ARMOS|nr:uncharacterized protein ARMOST_11836 [Armillaria ostoyae]